MTDKSLFLNRVDEMLNAGLPGGRYSTRDNRPMSLVLNEILQTPSSWAIGDIINYAIRFEKKNNPEDLVKIAAHAAMLYEMWQEDQSRGRTPETGIRTLGELGTAENPAGAERRRR